MSESVTKITGKTLVPISLVVTLLGGSGWLTNQHHMAKANATSIEDLRQSINEKERETDKILRSIDRNITEIKEDIGYIKGTMSSK